MPVRRRSQLPPRDNAVARISPVVLADDWTEPYRLWGATKITLSVLGAPIEVQFARADPPNPPEWDDPIPIPIGFWSHVGPFGYVRMRNQRAAPGGGGSLVTGGSGGGGVGTVYGAMYAE